MNHYLSDTLKHCSNTCESYGVQWDQTVVEDDFIQHSVEQLLNDNFKPKYNKVILNPPYLKISSKGTERAALRKVSFETGNLYSAFVGLAIKLLEEGG
ncbi:Eco57I restriction-modification methylase domain-containing protein, partial [Vibrio parahaemolyticus]